VLASVLEVMAEVVFVLVPEIAPVLVLVPELELELALMHAQDLAVSLPADLYASHLLP
jgi:hypothetical protein